MKEIDIILVSQAIDVIAECAEDCAEDVISALEGGILNGEDCGKLRMINNGECLVELHHTEEEQI